MKKLLILLLLFICLPVNAMVNVCNEHNVCWSYYESLVSGVELTGNKYVLYDINGCKETVYFNDESKALKLYENTLKDLAKYYKWSDDKYMKIYNNGIKRGK